MGTQQILLIVLSVIIVGAAIAVGITMFNNQAYSANKSALAADAQSFATQIVQYYKTPTSQGGAGQPSTAMDAESIGKYLGWDNETTTTDSGSFKITVDGTTGVKITGKGNETKGTGNNRRIPQVETTLTLADGKITATVADVSS